MKRYPTDLPCNEPGCDKLIVRSPQNKTGKCRSHAVAAANRDPELRARKSVAMKRYTDENPTFKAERTRAAAEGKRRMLREKPEVRQGYVERGIALGKRYGGRVETDYSKLAAKSRATRLGHIPHAYRGEYVELRRKKNLLAEERTEIVLNQAEVDARRHHAKRNENG